jgi:hypothetical protein
MDGGVEVFGNSIGFLSISMKTGGVDRWSPAKPEPTKCLPPLPPGFLRSCRRGGTKYGLPKLGGLPGKVEDDVPSGKHTNSY